MQNNFRTIKQKTKNFTIIDNRILQDKNLSLKARGLLCFMIQLPDTWVFTESGLAKVTGEGIRSIRSGLKELMEHKYLYRFQCKNDNGSFGNMIYYLFEEPTDMTIEEEPTEKQAKPEELAKYVVDKTHPDYEYINGGWMSAD